jgi:uncharacterized protein
MREPSTTSGLDFAISTSRFMAAVYCWMSVGLGLTGLIAYQMGTSGTAQAMIKNPGLFYGLLIGELALVYILSGAINKISSFVAGLLFLVYSAMNGITLSVVFLQYAHSSITSTFFICASTFSACAVYGYATKKDLSSLGDFLMMGLIGLIIAMIVNMFIGSTMMEFMISGIGVFVFVGLTAYDTQKLKEMSYGNQLSGSFVKKAAIMGALALYLDFINLFLFILRLFGINIGDD